MDSKATGHAQMQNKGVPGIQRQQQIFATPANTFSGAVAKLKIVRLARGDDGDTADHDLEAYQYDSDERWFVSVMRDFEHLSETAADEQAEAGEPVTTA